MSAEWIHPVLDLVQSVATLILMATIWRLQNEVRTTTTKGEK